MTLSNLAGLLLAAAASAGCPADLPAQQSRHQQVAGWLVEDRADEDGGRLVQIGREESGFSVHHHVSRARSDGMLSLGWSIRFGDCSSGNAEWLPDNGVRRMPSATARESLAGFLGECGARPLEIDAMLDGFETAYTLFREWAAQLEAAGRLDDVPEGVMERAGAA